METVKYKDFLTLSNYTIDNRSLFEKMNKGIYVKIPNWMIEKSKVVSKIRDENHKHDTRADFNPNATFIGTIGECSFGYYYNLPVDWSIKPNDKYDFRTSKFIFDIKTTEKNPFLNIKKRRLKTESFFIYVYCVCKANSGDVKMIGWIRGSRVLEYAKEKTKKKQKYYQIPYVLLNDMNTLTNLMV